MHARHAILSLSLVIVGVAACGGGDPQATTPQTTAVDPGVNATPSGEQIPPEKMDEINTDLTRKKPIMSHCLAIAVDNKELPKSSRGKVTVDITIGTTGKAVNAKIVNATLDSKTLNECVLHHINEIQFPELPAPFETSYTYGFEAM